MAPRASMSDLITRTRTLIGDGGTQFTEQQIQDALDLHRSERRYVALRPMPTYAPGGGVTYLDYYSSAQNWESDIQLQDMGYNTVTPTAYENIVGHWQFAAQPTGIGLRATGKTYDIFASAADLLEQWAAQVKLDFDFDDDKSKYARSQKFAQLVALANKYRNQADVHTTRMVQSETANGYEHEAITYPNVRGGY